LAPQTTSRNRSLPEHRHQKYGNRPRNYEPWWQPQRIVQRTHRYNDYNATNDAESCGRARAKCEQRRSRRATYGENCEPNDRGNYGRGANTRHRRFVYDYIHGYPNDRKSGDRHERADMPARTELRSDPRSLLMRNSRRGHA
jgi:hypothetical protein